MTRVAITADLHVDTYGMGRDSETGLDRRELDVLRTVAWVGRTARERGADVLVVAGDFTESKTVTRDGRGPSTGRIDAIRTALTEGPERQIHVRGNHDKLERGRSIVSVLADHEGWSGFDVEPGFEIVGGVAICCIPFLDRAFYRAQPGNETKPESQAFAELGELYLVIARGLYIQAIDAGASAAILVGHQQLPAELSDTQRSFLGDVDLVVDPRALSAIGYAAVVFGHVHRAQTIVDDPVCPVLFVGAPERVDFAEEGEDKSFVILDIVDGRATIERIPTPARSFVTLDASAWPQRDDDIGGPREDIFQDAIVRVVNVPPEDDVAAVRRTLENLGAFAVTSIKARPLEVVEAAGGMSESLSAEELLEQDLAEHPDREALVALGRELLAEVAA
jgi:DNA repair exonuclease SbcCD nuclease subunit